MIRSAFHSPSPSEVSPFLSWGFPVLLLLALLGTELYLPREAKPDFFSEGPFELIQAVIIGAACIAALRMTLRVEGIWLKLWYGIAALACFYIAGEEISWGADLPAMGHA